MCQPPPPPDTVARAHTLATHSSPIFNGRVARIARRLAALESRPTARCHWPPPSSLASTWPCLGQDLPISSTAVVPFKSRWSPRPPPFFGSPHRCVAPSKIDHVATSPPHRSANGPAPAAGSSSGSTDLEPLPSSPTLRWEPPLLGYLSNQVAPLLSLDSLVF
jgi:hypothetical protein